ncbi:hypothetical protein A2U01_0089700, partial [Trifolium medium]|nr:hypothetical protein [Trifolium medium]
KGIVEEVHGGSCGSHIGARSSGPTYMMTPPDMLEAATNASVTPISITPLANH